MALHLLPKSMFEAIDLLPEASTPVTLFTRHSLRELVNGKGLAGYDLQLTEQQDDNALHDQRKRGTHKHHPYRRELNNGWFAVGLFRYCARCIHEAISFHSLPGRVFPLTNQNSLTNPCT